MNYEITEQLPFTKDDIDDNNYTASIIMLCAEFNIFTISKLELIKNELNEIFVENASQYTSRESSTLSKEKANQLISSILFQSDCYLKSLNSVIESINSLKCMAFKLIVEYGKIIIQNCYDDCILIFKNVYQTKLDIDIHEYQYVINNAFDDFFKYYDGRFNSMDIPTSIDYPLLYGNAMNLQGAFYIHKYYENLWYENMLCNLYSQSQITEVLKAYGRIYNTDYKNLLFNVCEVVLCNMVAAELIGSDNILLTNNDLTHIYNLYAHKTAIEFENILYKVYGLCVRKVNNEHAENYFMPNFKVISREFHIHLKDGTLNNYICTH